MKTFTFPMFKKNNSYVQLKDMLNILPKNYWVWSILDFDGIGIPPQGLSMDEFTALIRKEPSGFSMTWDELTQFANDIEQTFDCLIVCVKSRENLDGMKFSKDDFSECLAVISAFDSSEWSIEVDEKCVPIMLPLSMKDSEI